MPRTRPPKPQDLNAQREVFCQLYAQNSELFGNATLSYAEAYSFDLDSLSRKCPNEDHGDESEIACAPSEYDIAYQTCSSNGSRLLRNAKVQERITALLNEMLKDDVVDAQLAKLILTADGPTRIAAIREYNKVRQRIVEKVDHTSGGLPIVAFNYVTPPDDRPNADTPAGA